MIETVCATAPIATDPAGTPVISTDFAVALLRSIASVAGTVDDPATFAAAISIEADALECRALEYARIAAH